MIVTMTTAVQHGAQALATGVAVDVPEEIGLAWIASGLACPDSPAPVTAVEVEPAQPARKGKAKG